jgi:hypothetical protein
MEKKDAQILMARGRVVPITDPRSMEVRDKLRPSGGTQMKNRYYSSLVLWFLRTWDIIE